MFRYFSCKFRLEPSKMKTARIVLFKEFGIMNSFTVEASFHSYLSKERVNKEFDPQMYQSMGRKLGETLYKDQFMAESEALERQARALSK
jgi:hypothetical protein